MPADEPRRVTLSDWYPDQKLRADATDEQYRARVDYEYRRREADDFASIEFDLAREFAAACVSAEIHKWASVGAPSLSTASAEREELAALLFDPEMYDSPLSRSEAANLADAILAWMHERGYRRAPAVAPGDIPPSVPAEEERQ